MSIDSQNEHKMLGNLFISHRKMTTNVDYSCLHLISEPDTLKFLEET